MTEREAFERWFSEDFMSGLDGVGEFDEERNCYVIFQVHMAWKGWQASRQQALEEIQPVLDRIKEHAEFNDPDADTKGGQLLMILGELECIRSPTPTKGPTP